MLTKLLIPVVAIMAMQNIPKELGINYLPLGMNGLNLALSPTMLGDKPGLVLKDNAKISDLLACLTKTKTERAISPQFIHFVFRFDGNVIYVDCDGVVQGCGGSFIVDPKLLEKRILRLGFPAKEADKAIPPEWQ